MWQRARARRTQAWTDTDNFEEWDEGSDCVIAERMRGLGRSFRGRILRGRNGQVNELGGVCSDSVKCHLPIEYSADLTPVVVGKGAGASWNAGGMENALDS